jgi:hypothetical protein
MKALNFVLPVAVAASISGAFFAGRYVGSYDAEKLHVRSDDLQHASESAERLYVAGVTADLLKDSKPSEALHTLEQYAQVQVPRVELCLKSPACSWWLAASEEHRVALRRYVNIYGGAAASGSR